MNSIKVDHKILQKFAYNILCAAGVDSKEATIIANVFVWFDLVGRYAQGVGRLHVYLKRLPNDLIKSPCHPEFKQKGNTAYLLNGNDGFGHYLGHIAMSKAIDIADQHGIGLVGVSHSNHFGGAAYYVNLATQSNKLGFALSNSVPHVAPFGGISAVIGTNPFAFGAPMENQKSVLVDFSTGASSGSMIMKAAEEGTTIPEGVVIDEEGNPIVDPKAAVHGIVLPFGGVKGYCLGLMVEILSGVITEAGFSHEIASLHRNFERSSNVGHFFMAIDISTLMPIEDYYERMNRLAAWIRDVRPQKNGDQILIPGEPQWLYYEKQLAEGIELDYKTIKSLNILAKEMDIKTPW
jgi:LDH2 family malate/lactate/ureidoglycolate dehydrogenase